MVISGWVANYRSVHSWKGFSAAPLGDQHRDLSPTQSHYVDPEPTRPCPILILLSTSSQKQQVYILEVIGLILPGFRTSSSR